MPPAILIHGPTASGKTALAISLARKLGGEIINADSMQVYSDLRVLNARPSDEELAQAPHHMFGHVDGAIRYSTGKWVEDAASQIDEIRRRGKIPILAGGTGLYLSSLTQGLSRIPEIPTDIRAKAQAETAASPRAAHEHLSRVDPEAAARIKVGDLQRVARALEVFMATGQPISHFHTPAPPFLKAGEWMGVALTPRRQELYARIEKRFDAMLETGAPDEARVLYERGLARDLPVMRAHGMPGFCDYFEGKCTLEAAVIRGKRDTRRYAKRQFTWIAHQFPTWPRIPADDTNRRVGIIVPLYNTAIDEADLGDG
ncbi:MAG: tRNA (adenosine(37)-N6)-dimethylallyltransferase MiaA [Hirschia sp.]|nr:tRNA (adenosine(37)-N6)-dimethylallyltransferase MiaA [Hirschia sp.]MBF19575.1 tRNA (adenosine(37)-N6)-dimethylallyltransferase MiaA [Hirschia sp.]